VVTSIRGWLHAADLGRLYQKYGYPRYLNNPSTTMTVAAAVGAATFEFRVFDEQNGMGNVLGQGIATQTVALDTPNSVSATLNGVVRGLRISLGARPNAGTAATVPVNVNALDADGNVILGPGDYSTPICCRSTTPRHRGRCRSRPPSSKRRARR